MSKQLYVWVEVHGDNDIYTNVVDEDTFNKNYGKEYPIYTKDELDLECNIKRRKFAIKIPKEETKMTQKNETQLMDGRLVPEFDEQFSLPIVTYRPHKWAMVDMQTGQVFLTDPKNVKATVGPEKEDIALLKKILNIGDKLLKKGS